MLYMVAKMFQASGLAIMAVGFVRNYPHILPHKIFAIAALLFGMGWLIQNYGVRNANHS
jgi:hypothetical protein